MPALAWADDCAVSAAGVTETAGSGALLGLAGEDVPCEVLELEALDREVLELLDVLVPDALDEEVVEDELVDLVVSSLPLPQPARARPRARVAATDRARRGVCMVFTLS